MTTAVEAQDLRVTRRGNEVLRGLDFSVAAGSLTGLIGPSGSGKTTLMRAIVGVQRNVTGRLAVLGAPAGTPALRAQVAYLTQAPSIYADLTVVENLRYFARILRARDTAVDEALAVVQLTGHAEQTVRSLSGGEQARVSLASALLGDPQLLVLDEPTVGLDPVLRQSLWDTFGQLAARGVTLIVSSHVMDEAERCDRVLLVRGGQLLADDTPDGIRSATGQVRLEDAFLTLVRGRGGPR
jgi:ABC-2 type transport system ATP-binding protein